jgi:hypothetical protein
MTVNEAFDIVYLITLDETTLKFKRLAKQLKDEGIKYQVSKAINGEVVPPPNWWTSGTGAWGCMLSHSRLWQEVWAEGIDKALFFEDDAILIDDFSKLFDEFWEELPNEWDQVYLGGQHRKFSGLISDRVMKPTSINRTHCYGLRRNLIPKILRHNFDDLSDYIDNKAHFDTHMEKAQRRNDWNVFTPSWWLVGQGESFSNIKFQYEPDRWWDANLNNWNEKLPVVFTYDKIDKTLVYPNQDLEKLDLAAYPNIMSHISSKAFRQRSLPAVHNPSIKVKRNIQRSWPKIIEDSVEQFKNYPKNKLFKHSWL